MEDNNWEQIKMKVTSCLDGDVDGTIPQDVRSLATMLLETGDNNVENRAALAGSVKAMLKDFPSGRVVWRRGNQGLLPASASVIVDAAYETIRNAAIVFFEETQAYSQPLLRKHGKSNGLPVYVDADDFAETMAKKAKATARELFKSKDWDGTFDGLQVCGADIVIQEEG